MPTWCIIVNTSFLVGNIWSGVTLTLFSSRQAVVDSAGGGAGRAERLGWRGQDGATQRPGWSDSVRASQPTGAREVHRVCQGTASVKHAVMSLPEVVSDVLCDCRWRSWSGGWLSWRCRWAPDRINRCINNTELFFLHILTKSDIKTHIQTWFCVFSRVRSAPACREPVWRWTNTHWSLVKSPKHTNKADQL